MWQSLIGIKSLSLMFTQCQRIKLVTQEMNLFLLCFGQELSRYVQLNIIRGIIKTVLQAQTGSYILHFRLYKFQSSTKRDTAQKDKETYLNLSLEEIVSLMKPSVDQVDNPTAFPVAVNVISTK
jgi:hypothetical protein